MLELSVVTDEMLGLADAGEDFSLCNGDHASLEANLPNGSAGFWTTSSGTIIESPGESVTNLSNLSPGNNIFVWTLSSVQCPDYHSDVINIYVEEVPQAVNDEYVMPFDTPSKELDLIQNDLFSANTDWYFELMNLPQNGTLSEMSDGVYEFKPEASFAGVVGFSYRLCSENCPDLCTSAEVRIQIDQPDFNDEKIPSGITPNGDGVNETFVFPQLEYHPEQYPDRELIIFNRWGDIVYQAKPYLNNWGGENQNGQPLPVSTYYYILRLDIGEGKIIQGDVTILK
jgi:gliding motility-associated-like protein